MTRTAFYAILGKVFVSFPLTVESPMQRRCAFSLIELAIVLVIMGLIVGGILAGSSMSQSQRLRGVLQDARMYSAAIQQFTDKYGALPGDMPDAARVFGHAEALAVTAACATPTTSASVGKLTCNGDGDGLIESAGAEAFRAWQMLSAAGMIGGSYTGIPGGGGATHSQPGINVPSGAVGNSGFALNSFGVLSGDTNSFDADYNNDLFYGGATTAAWPTASVLTPAEALGVDAKLDDGIPGTGNVMAPKSAFSACATTSVSSTAVYNVGNDTALCYLHFLRAFQVQSAGKR